MPITKKDGSPYTLSRPNPLAITQRWQEDSDLVLHNMRWKPTVVEGQEQPVFATPFQQQVEKHVPKVPATFLTGEQKKRVRLEPVIDIAALEAAAEEIVRPFEPPEPIVPKVDPKPVPTKNLVIFHCQPAMLRKRGDPFYGDSYMTVQYGEKFTFEGIVTSRQDLSMSFWTNVELTKGSIVYPKCYRDGAPFGEHRWWRIEKTIAKTNGFLVTTAISDRQPDFTD